MYKITYTGDGKTQEYIFAFPFFQKSDVKVAIDGDIVETNKYSVYPNDDLSGGRIVFLRAPEQNVQIDIFRHVTLKRVVDYQPTAKIDPEDLNTDFNLLLAGIQDIGGISINLAQWQNIHDNVLRLVDQTYNLIQDKLSGGGVLGIYNNLLQVLADAQPYLINDYGYVTQPAPNETCDDYGIL